MPTNPNKLSIERKKVELYSDFTINFDRNPFNGNLAKLTNEESVKNSLKNLFMTNKGERFYDSNKGTILRAMLFENSFGLGDFEAIKLDLIQVAQAYEPRAQIMDLHIQEPDPDQNSVSLKIVFSIINIPDKTFSLDIFINRVR